MGKSLCYKKDVKDENKLKLKLFNILGINNLKAKIQSNQSK
jgi:hypothetical protein